MSSKYNVKFIKFFINLENGIDFRFKECYNINDK